MKMSRRALRMQAPQANRPGAGLNLVSMMDIFTILVFFLLVQSSDVEVLPNAKKCGCRIDLRAVAQADRGSDGQ